MLPPTPSDLFDEAGRPRLGRYQGSLHQVDLSGRQHRRLTDPLRHKRWLYFLIVAPEHLCAAAIVDAGYAGNAFAFVASRTGLLARASALAPPRVGVRVGDLPEEGCDAWFRSVGLSISVSRPPGASAYRLRADSRDLGLDIVLDSERAPPAITAVSQPGGGISVTEKRVLLSAAGTARVGRETVPIDDALGGLDYTQGLLPRHTVWRWAFLLGQARGGTRVGLNLVQGFTGAPECALWLGDELHPLDEGRFTLAGALSPWRIATACGAVDLTFTPCGLHEEHRNLLLVRSRFLQPMGSYSGRVRLPGRPELVLDGVLGVAEDQDVLW
jgi:hypothetical protein